MASRSFGARSSPFGDYLGGGAAKDGDCGDGSRLHSVMVLGVELQMGDTSGGGCERNQFMSIVYAVTTQLSNHVSTLDHSFRFTCTVQRRNLPPRPHHSNFSDHHASLAHGTRL